MEEFKRRFKKTPWYFWFVLVIPEACKQAIPYKEIKGRAVELIISLLVGLISMFVLGTTEFIPNVGINLYTIIMVLGLTVVFRFIVGLFSIPSKLHQNQRALALRRTWEDVEIKPINFPNAEYWFGVGLSIASNKDPKDSVCFTHGYPKIIRISEGENEVYNDNTIGIELPIIIRKSKQESFWLYESLALHNHQEYPKESILAIHVAHCKNDKAMIKGEINDRNVKTKYEQEIGVPCHITIELRGETGPVGAWEMDVCRLICEIKENKKTGLSISSIRKEPG